MSCPLCHRPTLHPLHRSSAGTYFDCTTCGLVHLEAAARPSPEAERAHYELHENDPASLGYRAFLARAAAPLLERIPKGARGLDYGSGPGPTLSVMLEEEGMRMAIYDPYFAPDPSALDDTYDFITCTETVEHFFEPDRELSRLDQMLRPGGWLVVMTELLDDDRDFSTWHYARDPTHVSFYRLRTLEFIAKSRGWSFDLARRSVALFRKPPSSTEHSG